MSHESTIERPWYRLHWGTWLAGFVVAGALAYCQTLYVPGDAPMVYGGYVDVTVHGWPLLCVERTESGHWIYQPKLHRGPPTDIQYAWSGKPLALNALAWVALLLGTLIAVETWLRRPRFFQVGLSELLVATAVIAAMLGWWYWDYHRFDSPSGNPEIIQLFRHFSHSPFVGKWMPWYPRLPVLFAIACSIYAAGWLAVQTMRRLWRLSARRGTRYPRIDDAPA
jgi:hypothetical protein